MSKRILMRYNNPMIDALDRHILLADDDERIRTLLKEFLMRAGYRVSAARDGGHVERLVAGLSFDLLILDVMMPVKDGITLTRDLRETIDTPIILLTAKSEAEDRIAGLEAGCDDFISKPFEPKELLLRMAAIFRRIDQHSPRAEKGLLVSFGPMRFDTKTKELWAGDHPLHLTGVEADILAALAQTPNQVTTRNDLAARLGRSPESMSDRTIDVQITRLRRKIETDPKEPRYLQTVRGEGYLLSTE